MLINKNIQYLYLKVLFLFVSATQLCNGLSFSSTDAHKILFTCVILNQAICVYIFFPSKIKSIHGMFSLHPSRTLGESKSTIKEVLFFVKNTKINTGFYISFVRILFGEIVLLHCYIQVQ